MTKGVSGLQREDWWRAVRWQMAKETGWSLEYIDNLSWGDVWEYMQLNDADAKWGEHLQSRAQSKAQTRGRRR